MSQQSAVSVCPTQGHVAAKTEEYIHSAKDTANTAQDKAGNAANSAKDKAGNAANSAKDKASNAANSAQEKASDVSKSTEESGQHGQQQAAGILRQTSEKVMNMAQGAVDNVKNTLGMGDHNHKN